MPAATSRSRRYPVSQGGGGFGAASGSAAAMRASSSFTIAAFLLQGVSVQSQNWSRRCEKGEKTRLQASRPRDRRRPLLSGSDRKECRSGLHPRRPRSLLQSCHGKIAIMLSPCSRAQQGPPKAGPVSWPAPRAASTTIASKLAPRARQDRRRLEAAIAFAGWPTAHDNRLQDAGDFVSTLEAVVHLQQATKKTKPIHSGCDSRG